MSVIDHDRRPVLTGDAADLGQLDVVAFHAEDAVHDDKFAGFGLKLLHSAFKRRHVLVGEAQELSQGEQAPLDDARVIALVAQDVFAFADQGADDAEVDLEPGAVEQDGLFVNEFGQGGFQLQVDVQAAVEEARAGATGAVFRDRRLSRGFDLRVVGQAQVAVGAQHEDFLALNHDFGVLARGNGAEIGVQPEFPQLVGGLELPGFGQQRARLLGGRGLKTHWPVVNLPGGGGPRRRVYFRLFGSVFFQSGGLIVVNHKQARRYEAESTQALTRYFKCVVHRQQHVTNSPLFLIFSKTGPPFSRPLKPFSSLPFTLYPPSGKYKIDPIKRADWLERPFSWPGTAQPRKPTPLRFAGSGTYTPFSMAQIGRASCRERG